MIKLIKKNPQQKALLAKVAAYTLFLFCFFPLIVTIVLPYFTGLPEHPYADFHTRFFIFIGTGCISGMVAFIPFYVLSFGLKIVQKLYVFMLLPFSLVGVATQVILYLEFGSSIDRRLMGIFEGNAESLWVYAGRVYHVEWLIVATVLISYGMMRWFFKKTAVKTGVSRRVVFVFGGLTAVFSVFALVLNAKEGTVNSYHPMKLAQAPMYQLFFVSRSVLGEYGITEEVSCRSILEKTAPVKSQSDRGEIEKRLGKTIESYVSHKVTRPLWLKKKPSHIFMFLMESFGGNLITNPELQALAPRINSFAQGGISVSMASSSGKSTMLAVNGISSGLSASLPSPPISSLRSLPLDTLPQLMKKGGYDSLFLAGSYRRCGDKGDVCEAYGYRFIGCPDVQASFPTNEWGVCDADFFAWSKSLVLDLKKPHFITFLNVSNHGPFDAPLDTISIPEFSSSASSLVFGASQAKKKKYMGHIFYADHQIGEMVDVLKSKYPDALFIFRGDHCSARFRRDARSFVPLIFWNNSVIDSSVDASEWFGMSMDMVATLANLILPEGETFRTVGLPVWDLSPERVSVDIYGVLSVLSGYESKDNSSKDEHSFTLDANEIQTQSRLKASAIQALSWDLYSGNRTLPLSLPEDS